MKRVARLTPAEIARLRLMWRDGKRPGDTKPDRRWDIVNAPPKPVELEGVPVTEGLDARALAEERFGPPINEAHAASREKAARFGAPEGAEPTRCRRCGLPITQTEDDRWAHIGPTSCTRVVLDEGRSA